MRLPWNKQESDLDREVRYHLETLADAFERYGFSKADAMARARREFRGLEQTKEKCRDERRWSFLATVSQDLAFGSRMMRKTPGVTAAAVLSLALGIGATTAIWSLVDAVLWRTLAVPHPEQLTDISWQSKGSSDGVFQSSSGSMFRDGTMQVADFFNRASFDALRARTEGRFDIAAHMHPEEVSTSYSGTTAIAQLRPVSGNFFTMLGVQPSMGRLLMPSDDRPAADFAVAVSHPFWRKNLGSDARAIGRTMRVNNRAYTITGVLPANFGGIATGDATDLYTTIEHAPALLKPDSWERKAATDPMSWYLQLIGRQAPGTSREALTLEMQSIFRSTWAGEPKDPEGAPAIRLQDASGGIGSLRREFGSPLVLLFGLVGCVLLVACVNIANLMLARADSRRKEVALRVSLGCSRGRLVRQFFTESALLAACGGLLSLLVAYATANFAVTLMPGDLRLAFEIDGRMIVATIAVTAFTAVAFGLYPAWRAAHMDAAPALKEASGGVGRVSHGWLAPGKVLVLAQVALGVLLVTAGAAFTTHLRQIMGRDTGFERTRLLLFDLRPGESGYEGARLRQFYIQLEQRLQQVPGVQSVGLARVRPMMGGGYHEGIRVPGRSERISTAVNFVTSGYLATLGVPILAGRGITDADIRSQASVAVVSEDLGAVIGRSPLGMVFRIEDKPVEIVGVASRARYSRLTQQPHVLYLPNTLARDSATVLLRTSVPPTQVLPGLREAVAELDANLPLVETVTMQDQIAATLRRERLFAWLCGTFGVLALLLCMIGLYGVMSYATTRRTQEIGVRMALGASPANVLRHVLGEGLAIALAGCALGAPVAWWIAQRYIDYKKLGMQPIDPSILGWASAALAMSALLAVLAPAMRAAAADPMKALREG